LPENRRAPWSDSVKQEVRATQDGDERWRERRRLARRLVDLGDAATAYRVVREAAPPVNPYYRAEFHFMPGWIALRFLNDPSAAMEHFARIDENSADPVVRARAAYWRGRAAEAAGHFDEMRAQYEAAARYPTTYYGQLANARLGLGEIAMRPPPEPTPGTARELVHAVDMLYAIGERDLAVSFMTDLAKESNDVAYVAAVGQVTARYNDAQAMLLIGKTALARGMAMDQYAFPDIGVPLYSAVGPQLDRCVVYSIVRTESGFDQRDKSPANAVGLMQVTPEAGRDTAKRFGVAYDWKRLVSDPVYNTQMGAAEVAALLKEYRGSYVMAFAGYNAGRGRVQEWVAKHGDPRDPKIDAVDWVERIPFAETRNYVQRVISESISSRLSFVGDTMRTCRSTARALGPVPRPSSPTYIARRRLGRAPGRSWWKPPRNDLLTDGWAAGDEFTDGGRRAARRSVRLFALQLLRARPASLPSGPMRRVAAPSPRYSRGSPKVVRHGVFAPWFLVLHRVPA
jgi:peptidoglycan lytic transglycosylase